MSKSSLVLERQQAKLLAALRRAQGAELTYDDLREAGIEFPATVISELELAGVPIERRYGGRGALPSFRLDPDRAAALDPDRAAALDPDHSAARDPGARTAQPQEIKSVPAAEPAARWEPVHIYRGPSATRAVEAIGAGLAALGLRIRGTLTAVAGVRRSQAGRASDPQPDGASHPPTDRASGPRRDRPSGSGRDRASGGLALSPARLLSGVALLAAAVTVTVLTLGPVGPGAPRRRVAARPVIRPAPTNRPAIALHQPTPSRTHRVHHLTHRSATPANPAPAPTSPAGLEASGHALMDSGQYASAIPVLQQAVRATGANPAACAQPTSENCLTYAFALYDLGRSLRLSGDPAAAVPVLEQRLEINNQHGAVAQELALAQGGASQASPAGQLEARGHSLMESGEYTSAIPVLNQAIQAAKENPGACAQPTNQNCLTYAFALYDLGRTLRLGGDPAAAVPILKQRLQINNQHDAVAQELALAQNATSH